MLLVEENHVQTKTNMSEGQCSSRIRMVDEDEVEAEEVDSTYPTKGTQNFGYKKEAMEEPSQEGGASTPA